MKEKLPTDDIEIEKLYKDSLENFNSPVSDAVWNSIENNLNMPSAKPGGLNSWFKGKYILPVIISFTAILVFIGWNAYKKESSPAKIMQPATVLSDTSKSKEVKIPKKIVRNSSPITGKVSRDLVNPVDSTLIKEFSNDQEQKVHDLNKDEEKTQSIKKEHDNSEIIQSTQDTFYEKMLKAKKDSTREIFIPKSKDEN